MERLKARRVIRPDGADDHSGEPSRLAALGDGIGHAQPPGSAAIACAIRAAQLGTTTTGWFAWCVTWCAMLPSNGRGRSNPTTVRLIAINGPSSLFLPTASLTRRRLARGIGPVPETACRCREISPTEGSHGLVCVCFGHLRSRLGSRLQAHIRPRLDIHSPVGSPEAATMDSVNRPQSGDSERSGMTATTSAVVTSFHGDAVGRSSNS